MTIQIFHKQYSVVVLKVQFIQMTCLYWYLSMELVWGVFCPGFEISLRMLPTPRYNGAEWNLLCNDVTNIIKVTFKIEFFPCCKHNRYISIRPHCIGVEGELSFGQIYL